MTTDLAQFAADNNVKYFMISFTDLFGGQRAKLVPARAIADMQIDGAGFAGFATWLDLTPAHPDMLAVPDPEAVIILPWNPEIAWVPADCVMEGEPVAQAPRNVLRRLIDEAAEEGMRVKTGIEAEFFLLTPDGEQISDPFDTAAKPCYDQQAFMRRLDVIQEISDHMLELGWNPYQNDHEDANGQWEMNWDYDDALATADKHSFFKFMVKTVAEKHGYRATFMPKPVEGLTGNGCHAHISVWDLDGNSNVFAMEPNDSSQTAELGLSEQGRNFLGRTHMVRVPGPGRFELRLPDGAVNPYLLQAVIIAAGLSGVRSKADPGKRYDIDMYAEGHKVRGAPKLPLNMLDALRAFDKDKDLKAAMGEEFSSSFIKMKMQEWDSFVGYFSQWEKQNTMDI